MTLRPAHNRPQDVHYRWCTLSNTLSQQQSGDAGRLQIFNLWLEDDLLPKLPPGAVIVLDNASFHKRADTEEMIKNAGHYIEFLLPYSPDLNPIEPKWAQAKATICRTGMSPDQIFPQTF